MVSRVQQALCDAIHHNRLVEYLADRCDLNEDVLCYKVCWTSIAQARKQATFTQRKFITKWISGDTPSGVEMHCRQQRDCPNCPIYMTEDESLVHILTCSDSRSVDLRATLLLELHEWLIAELTCPWIREFLFYGLQSWFDDPEGHEPGLNWHETFAPSVQAQLSLGW